MPIKSELASINTIMAQANISSPQIKRPLLEQLRGFVPIYTLDPERQQELANNARCISLPAGSKLFKIGDPGSNILYLLRGEVELSNRKGRTTLVAGSKQARLPLDPHQPHQSTATLRTDAEFIIIERNLMEVLLTKDTHSGYVVNDLDADACAPDDWMAVILQSPVFQRIPPLNIQTMFQKLQSYSVRAKDVIFLQGDEGDYFYLIQQGVCTVIRKNGKHHSVIAELTAGQSFGEEALLSQAPRNATVIMKSNGVLLRLAKSDFADLFEHPVVETITLEQAKQYIARNPILIDVRQPEEHAISAIKGSLNIPLNQLRQYLHNIDRNRPCIVYCDDAHRSSCAVYLLSASGYEAYALKYDIQAKK